MPTFDPKHPQHSVPNPGPKLDPAKLPAGLRLPNRKALTLLRPLFASGQLITADQLLPHPRPRTNATTLLYPILLTAFPSWIYGLQAIGDCMAWSSAHGIDIAASVEIHLRNRNQRIIAPTMIEALYGFMRVEARGLDENPEPDGAYPPDAVNAMTRWGTLHYTTYLGGQHVFQTYDPTGARSRYYGRHGVPDELEPIAVRHRATRCVLVRTFDEACDLIDAGCPIINAHLENPIPRSRDADGFGIDAVPAPHAMNYIGYRRGNRPGLLQTNTGHGFHVDGPRVPDDMPDVIAHCSAWLDEATVNRVLAAQWTYALEGYEGATKAIRLDFPIDWRHLHPTLVY